MRQAVERFVHVLAHCGCAPQAIEDQVRAACRRIRSAWPREADLRDSLDPGHVLTMWFSDPAYLDRRGNPRPLPIDGSSSSIEALARRVDPNLDGRYVARYLQRGGALKRMGSRYVPRDRVLIFRGREGMTPFLRGLFGLLRTLEHNSHCGDRSPGWLERFTRNIRFPISARERFEKRLRVLVNRLVVQTDADMHLLERARKKGERTIRMGLGVYQFEEDPPARRELRKKPGASRTSRRARRRRT